ncbi:Uncharacterised protein [Mycobacteroides abscessus subsp. abscessus]|nr:Uncharacterised protein [Mycobacteroides abscessus subsp. abscessus]SKT84661.1 Uncharacterised protein [Mycobacteroides abscessus subsp. abscessus]
MYDGVKDRFTRPLAVANSGSHTSRKKVSENLVIRRVIGTKCCALSASTPSTGVRSVVI